MSVTTKENSRYTPFYNVPTNKYFKKRRLYRLTRDMSYQSEKYGLITVPRGFETDRTSVPRILTPLFPIDHSYLEAAIVHDYMYDNAIGSKKIADDILEEGMRHLGVKKWRIFLMMLGVRLLGKGRYKQIKNKPLPSQEAEEHDVSIEE